MTSSIGQIGARRDLTEGRVCRGRDHAEIRLPGPGPRPQDLPMSLTDALLPPTTAAVRPVRGLQQPGRPRRPGSPRP